MKKFREIAVEIARKTGNYLLENFRKDNSLLLERGLSKEITTKYDKEADKIIINELINNFPEHSILTEESGLIEPQTKNTYINTTDKYQWIIDSMDGSGNFASGNPYFSVSIALIKNNKIILGVIYAPFLDELYIAEKNKGSTLNGEKIQVSDINILDKSYIVACEGGSKTNEKMTKLFQSIYPNVKDMRKIGSAALECGLVASGRADGYTTLSIYPWDVAAGVLLVQEAGGKITNYQGKQYDLKQTDLICSNNKIHDLLLEKTKNI